MAQAWQEIEHSYSETIESAHHRIERRQVWVVPLSAISNLRNSSKWKGLASIVMVRRERKLWNKTTTEVCFYISSLSAEAEAMAKLIRSHWGIENSCHWVLDVVFGEDDSRVRTGHAAENMGLLRRLSLNLLKREPSKQSLRMKRYRAAMDNDFALALLAGEQGC